MFSLQSYLIHVYHRIQVRERNLTTISLKKKQCFHALTVLYYYAMIPKIFQKQSPQTPYPFLSIC